MLFACLVISFYRFVNNIFEICLICFFVVTEHNSQCSSKRKSSAGSNSINGTNVTTQTQPIIQPSSELQSIQQQREYEQQHRHNIESQTTNDRSEPTATRSTAREARPTGTKRKN